MYLRYSDNKQAIEALYSKLGLNHRFEKDNCYLENAFNEINKIWIENYNKIYKVKYILIAEAPLWGENKNYIYNLNINNTQFFYRSDLESILNIQIADKKQFIKECAKIGLLIVDISPFALNTVDTAVNYSTNTNTSKKLSLNEYKKLVKQTLPTFFNEKMYLIGYKKALDIKVFFRYARVKNTFQDLIFGTLIQNGIIKDQEDIKEISQIGGGIDRGKLKQILLK